MCQFKKLKKLKLVSLDLQKRISDAAPLAIKRFDYVSTAGLTYSDLSEKLDKMKSCASIVETAETWIKEDDGLTQVMKIAAANYCKQSHICPVCADRSQARRRARHDTPIRDQVKKVAAGDRHAYIVTYTIKDGDSLAERLAHLKESKRNFVRMGQRRYNKRSLGESGKIRAALSTIEIKRGENSDAWHVHAHDLVFTDKQIDYSMYDREKYSELKKRFVGRRIPKEELSAIALNHVSFNGEMVPASKLSAEWLASTGGDSIGIDIEPLKHVPKSAKGKKKKKYERMSFEDSISYQARECLKYFVKPGAVSPEDSIVIVEDTYNKRMTATYGEFRGVIGDDYIDDTVPDDSDRYVVQWTGADYGNPIPGILRDFTGDQVETETRSKCGRVTSNYRRQRSKMLSMRDQYGSGLFSALDAAKSTYRATINAIWSSCRQKIQAAKRIDAAGCDNYKKFSPVMAQAGYYVPGSDSRDIYANAFS